MATATEYALMAGRVYQTTRDKINWLPDLQSLGWTEFFHVPNNPDYPAFTAVWQRGRMATGTLLLNDTNY
ncbi:MAG: hypothetical protein OEV28_13195 [Nitrospirota bacterium]|nr:hypothetical protein [Nitrospirota bacterium]